jgi:hypothetical protein
MKKRENWKRSPDRERRSDEVAANVELLGPLLESPLLDNHQFGDREGSRMADNGSILVTGAAGQLGAVGRTVTGLLRERGLPVRALVRREDDRAAALWAAGAEVVVGDLLEPADVDRVVRGCRRVYFGMSVSAGYLEATVTMAAVVREVGVNALVNMSQMTVSRKNAKVAAS